MDTLKKALSICLAASMCLSISACGKKEKKSALVGEGQIVSDTNKKTHKEASETVDDMKNDNEKSDDKKEEGKASEGEVAVEKENTVYTLGTVKDNTYESEFIGIRVNASDGWKFEEQEVINQMNEQLANSDEEGQKYMKYEAVMVNPSEKSQVIISVDGNKGEYDVPTYLAYVAANYKQETEGDIENNIMQSQIAGKSYYTINIAMNGAVIRYNVRKAGDNMITIIEAFQENNESVMTNLMSSIKKY